MKHKLKGLVCLWLAVLLLALPALAAYREVWIYTDTANTIDVDFQEMQDKNQVQKVPIDDSLPMNQQTQPESRRKTPNAVKLMHFFWNGVKLSVRFISPTSALVTPDTSLSSIVQGK